MQIYDSGSQPVRGQYTAYDSNQTPVDNATEGSDHTRPCPKPRPDQTDVCQSHVHEFQGSTKIAEAEEEPHNHRFAGVTSQVIPVGTSHVHVVFTNTDFFEDHHHEVAAVSGPPIIVGDEKHVHFFNSVTTVDDDHFHEFQFATLIQSPITD